MDRREYVCNQMYKQHDLLRKGSWTDADKLEYMELNIAPYSRYWRMGMKKALKHAIRLLREEEAKADRKTEPTISKMEQVDEPKTQTKTQNSNLTFEKTERKCIDCNFLTYMFGKTWCNIKCENPHDKVCDRFKPKDEPQTERGDE